MTFSSSPVVYPPSSSPAQPSPNKKRAAIDLGTDQPKPKKRLFGTALWDAANILRAETGNEKISPAVSVPEPQPAAVFKDPRAVNSTLTKENITEETSVASEEPDSRSAWSFARLGPAREYEQLSSRTCSGKQIVLCRRKEHEVKSHEQMIAERSKTVPGRATTSYYGVDIHKLIDEANAVEQPCKKDDVANIHPAMQSVGEATSKRRNKHAMWTEKYRARKFTDLVGDERTHRSVLRWLKGWDSVVFPGAKPIVKGQVQDEDTTHRKILLLTGPPGLGKTTLAHVCAKQAGYEVVEINASDERSRDIVKGRIRDCVGTENVRGINAKVGDSTVRKAGRPVCVIVDEVDGVVSGSGGSGEGGFIKALIDLVMLDQKNSQQGPDHVTSKKGKKGDRFRLLRPMILICNELYHPSLRPLRSSNLAEIVHVRKPALDKVITRLKNVFEKEGVPADSDGVRRLCEATWGVSSKRDDEAAHSSGEGDLRGVLVVGEWAARRLRASQSNGSALRLSRQWVEKNMIPDLTAAGSGARGIGRGGSKETAERVFLENAGFSKSATAKSATSTLNSIGVVNSITDAARANAMTLLRTAIDTAGEHDRILSDIFTSYPTRPFQDDTFLTKPNAAAEWLHFHDLLSSRVSSSQEWELFPYLSASILGFHQLFGSTNKFNAKAAAPLNDLESEPLPFSGPRADFEAYEAEKAMRATLQSVQASLSLPLFRTFRSAEELATDLLPNLSHMLAPNVSPVVIGGSGNARGTASVRREGERAMVERAASAMSATGVTFEKARVEDARSSFGSAGFVLRMEPPIDTLSAFATAASTSGAPARYAVRQVLDQAHAKLQAEQAAAARTARFTGGLGLATSDKQASGSQARGRNGMNAGAERAATGTAPLTAPAPVKRDFFGRPVATPAAPAASAASSHASSQGGRRATIWVTFHEGFSNAVRKPVSLSEVLAML